MFQILILFLLLHKDVSLPFLNSDIGEAIFNQNETYIIYVYHENFPGLQIFTQYCENNKLLCAILNKQVDSFERFTNFIGEKNQNYLLIVDLEKRKKFTMEVNNTINSIQLCNVVQKIQQFWFNFRNNTLTPFYSSQQIPNSLKCQKVVGLTLQNFLKNQAKIKILLILIDEEMGCELCGVLLQKFCKYANKFNFPQIVDFGYIDIVKNNHQLMTEEEVPQFLVYTDNLKKPVKIQGKQIEDLIKVIELILEKQLGQTQFKKLVLNQSQNSQNQTNEL